jgi:hypothetical protein
MIIFISIVFFHCRAIFIVFMMPHYLQIFSPICLRRYFTPAFSFSAADYSSPYAFAFTTPTPLMPPMHAAALLRDASSDALLCVFAAFLSRHYHF